MPIPYQAEHRAIFDAIAFAPQGEIFVAPAVWRRRHNLPEVPSVENLPNVQINRQQVRELCCDPDRHVLFSYVCAMAWGGQGQGPGKAQHVRNAWIARGAISEKLAALRVGNLSRAEAYDLFSGHQAIAGLGPSYLTKLLYFFSPELTFYIMDQWTVKSVNLLTGEHICRIHGAAPSYLNTGRNYQAFCEVVDDLAVLHGSTGEEIEQRLFSSGGIPRAPWRQHVYENWLAHRPQHRYSSERLREIFPDIFGD